MDKGTRPELLLLKRLNLQLCPLHVEEPIFAAHNRDEHDTIFSGFLLSRSLRKNLADKVRKASTDKQIINPTLKCSFSTPSIPVTIQHAYNVALIVYEMLQYYPQWLAEELMETRRKLTIATMELENKKKEMEKLEFEYSKTFNGDSSGTIQHLEDQLQVMKQVSQAKTMEVECLKQLFKQKLSEEQEKVEVERQKLKNDVEEKREKLTQDLQSLEDKEKRLIEEKIKLHIEKLKQEEEYKRKMQDLAKKEEKLKELQESGNIQCIRHCRDESIVSQKQAIEILKKEFNNKLCPFILEFDPSGFHILHEVLIYLSSEQGWKEVDEKHTCIKKYCNLMKISQSGLAASVVLYVRWPIETQIECYIDSTDDASIICAREEIVQAVGYVLAKKNRSLRQKCYCCHPQCLLSDDIHFASPHGIQEGFLVCEKWNHKYPCPKEQQCLLVNTRALERIVFCYREQFTRTMSMTMEYQGASGTCTGVEMCQATSFLVGQQDYTCFDEIPMSEDELLRHIKQKVFEKWKMIATLLGLFEYIPTISKKHRDEPDDCFLEVVQKWKESDSKPFTWTTIINILQHEHVGKADVAKKIIDHLNTLT